MGKALLAIAAIVLVALPALRAGNARPRDRA